MRHEAFFNNNTRLVVLLFVIVQFSHPYKSTYSTVVINSRCLIWRESVDFHISFFNWLSALYALAFLVLMPLSVVQTKALVVFRLL